MTADPRLVRALVACYPAGWRRRYGDEYAELLCDLRVHRRPGLILDSLGGAARAHGGVLMTRNSPMTAAVRAAGLFTVGGIGFAKLAEDFTGTARGAYVALVLAAAVALLALVAAAAPSLPALVHDRAARRYVAVPVVGAVAWWGVVRLAAAVADGHGAHAAPTVTAFLLTAATGVAVVAATAWAAAKVLRRLPEAARPRFRPAALTVVAAGMAATTIAALTWGLQIRAGDPAAFRGDDGLLATPFPPSWIAVTLTLTAATAMAVLAALSARRSARPV
ncbi:hypothetical protein ACQP2F_12165 [Actinoplanes sp. CA-030573]|uniref:hypothetical protein n=1 Tax=Actinoplanes sp. CA-030573 TaxID=3239898 RepID=UPI003D8EED99